MVGTVKDSIILTCSDVSSTNLRAVEMARAFPDARVIGVDAMAAVPRYAGSFDVCYTNSHC